MSRTPWIRLDGNDPAKCTTPELMDMRIGARIDENWEELELIKAELAKRPHIPNKMERAALRKQKMHEKQNR